MTTPTRNEVTLKGRGGLTITLFNPILDSDGDYVAQAVYVNQSVKKRNILKDDQHRKFRPPAIHEPGFYLANIVLKYAGGPHGR